MEQRWIAEIDVFDHVTQFKSGRTNRNADALSRYPVSQPVGPEEEFIAVTSAQLTDTPLPFALTAGQAFCNPIAARTPSFPLPVPCPDVLDAHDLREAQQSDPDLALVVPFLTSKTMPSPTARKKWTPMARSYLRQIRRLQLRDGVVVRRLMDAGLGESTVVVVPAGQQQHALQLAHDQCGHQGPERTYEVLRSRCYWPNMQEAVRQHCHHCQRCLVAKRPSQRIQQCPGHLVATRPLEIVAIDFLKLDQAADGREDVLVFTDVFTKWSVAVPTRDQTAKTVVNALINNWIVHYGVPLRLHSD